ncbi:hypothetical protein B0H10DRAFT_2349876 [Mycena sp. CBHHK59/15]|nr:hypothetical protein B0H10DRAFT_2349876 [Mycena sp. CBHHK59/15]
MFWYSLLLAVICSRFSDICCVGLDYWIFSSISVDSSPVQSRQHSEDVVNTTFQGTTFDGRELEFVQNMPIAVGSTNFPSVSARNCVGFNCSQTSLLLLSNRNWGEQHSIADILNGKVSEHKVIGDLVYVIDKNVSPFSKYIEGWNFENMNVNTTHEIICSQYVYVYGFSLPIYEYGDLNNYKSETDGSLYKQELTVQVHDSDQLTLTHTWKYRFYICGLI